MTTRPGSAEGRLVMPGSTVRPWGKVGAVGWKNRCDERYYMLLDKRGVVSLMPASVIEPAYEEQRHRSGARKEK